MQDERPYRPLKPLRARLLVHVCYVAACLCFLTVVNAYMQLDFPQIYHGGHAEKKQNVRGKNVTSLQESVCVCVLLQDSQVRYVWSSQRGQHASSPKKAVLHNSKTLQQLLPVNQTTRCSLFIAVCLVFVCVMNSLGKSVTVFQHS